jgi:predicted RNA-binding Zn-ribbon protein involved in translation (DUF1610 family)
MYCKTFSHINEDGTKTYKDKHKFNTLDDAITECKKLNANSNQLTKLVSYKCPECHKYHIGRNGKPVTDKYREKLEKTKPTPTFKIVGKINL